MSNFSATIRLLLCHSLVRLVGYSALAPYSSFAPTAQKKSWGTIFYRPVAPTGQNIQQNLPNFFSILIGFNLLPTLTHDSRLTTHDSRLTTHDSRLTTHRSQLTTHYSPLTILMDDFLTMSSERTIIVLV